ncbi:MAG: cellulase family glycosylhydrolase, partial [Lachnospira sp.]|nr:cellulase family glycosylhydrolase [Lachnospira sp.]
MDKIFGKQKKPYIRFIIIAAIAVILVAASIAGVLLMKNDKTASKKSNKTASVTQKVNETTRAAVVKETTAASSESAAQTSTESTTAAQTTIAATTPETQAPNNPGASNSNLSGYLHTSGNKLVDGSGNVVQLRGVSTHGISWFPEYVNYDAFASLKNDWGANVVRLAMYPAEYNGYLTGGDKNALKQI